MCAVHCFREINQFRRHDFTKQNDLSHLVLKNCRSDTLKRKTIASFLGTTNVFRLCLVARTHPKILQFDFSPSIIILFGKHNVVGSQKNYRIALQKTNNLLALCLTEQHCQPARNHPFSTIHVLLTQPNIFVEAPGHCI